MGADRLSALLFAEVGEKTSWSQCGQTQVEEKKDGSEFTCRVRVRVLTTLVIDKVHK